MSPADGAIEVEPGATVTLAFSEPMDPATLNGANIRLLDGDVPIAAELSCTGGTTCTLTPNRKLALLAPYRVVVDPSVASADGVPLMEGFESELVTRDGAWNDRGTIDLEGDEWLDDSGLHDGFHSFAFDAQGNALFAWVTLGAPSDHADSYRFLLKARWYRRGEGWQPTITLADFRQASDKRHSFQFAVAVDPNGDAVLAWPFETTIPDVYEVAFKRYLYVRRYRDGVWEDAPHAVFSTGWVNHPKYTNPAVTDFGVDDLVVRGGQILMRGTDNWGESPWVVTASMQGDWSQTVSRPGLKKQHLCMAINAAGDADLIELESPSTLQSNAYQISLRAGQWHSARPITQVPEGRYELQMVPAGSGFVGVWGGDASLQTTYSGTSGEFSEAKELEDFSAFEPDTIMPCRLRPTPLGAVTAWSEGSLLRVRGFDARQASWGDASLAYDSPNSAPPASIDLGADAHDNALVALYEEHWADTDPPEGVHTRRRKGADGEWTTLTWPNTFTPEDDLTDRIRLRVAESGVAATVVFYRTWFRGSIGPLTLRAFTFE